MRLVLHKPVEIALFDLVELPEEILLSQYRHDLLKQNREITEGLGRICAKDLAPRDESPKIGLELQR